MVTAAHIQPFQPRQAQKFTEALFHGQGKGGQGVLRRLGVVVEQPPVGNEDLLKGSHLAAPVLEIGGDQKEIQGKQHHQDQQDDQHALTSFFHWMGFISRWGGYIPRF